MTALGIRFGARRAFAQGMHRDANEENDVDLLRQIGRGDREAFESFYRRHAAWVAQMLRHSFRLTDDVPDVVQEVFLQVWLRAHSYDPERGPAAAWLVVVARSRAVDLLRKRAKLPVEDADPSLVGHAPEVHPVDALWVGRALDRLPPQLRSTMRLAFFEGFSHSQIARRLGRPLGTVKTQIRTCLRVLRQLECARAH